MFVYFFPQYELLRLVENIQLAPMVLEPDPVEVGLPGRDKGRDRGGSRMPEGGPENARWSGDATRGSGFRVEDTNVAVTFGEGGKQEAAAAAREMPVWMQESTVVSAQQQEEEGGGSMPAAAAAARRSSADEAAASAALADQSDEITSMLLKHEKRNTGQPAFPSKNTFQNFVGNPLKFFFSSSAAGAESDSDNKSDESDLDDDPMATDTAASAFGGGSNLESLGLTSTAAAATAAAAAAPEDVEAMSDDGDDDDVPTVSVGDEEIPVTDVDEAVIARMTAEEKERYTQTFQDFYANVYD